MDDHLQTLEHAQNTANDLAIRFGPRMVATRTLRLADFRVQIAARPSTSVDDFNTASSDITQATPETFRARGIVIPLPQQEIQLLGATAGAGTA